MNTNKTMEKDSRSTIPKVILLLLTFFVGRLSVGFECANHYSDQQPTISDDAPLIIGDAQNSSLQKVREEVKSLAAELKICNTKVQQEEHEEAQQEQIKHVQHVQSTINDKSKPSSVVDGKIYRKNRRFKLPYAVPDRSPTIPLDVLAGSAKAGDSLPCPEGLKLVNDTLLDPSLLYKGPGRKIPRMVHTTSISRCIHPKIADNLDDWKFPEHSFFLHDDDAVERLLFRDWPEFPMLHHILHCLPNKGAVMADIWRVLLLWEYGGIYTDMDTGIIPHMFNGSTITDEDGYFVTNPLGQPTQWFMAVSPRHPMMYYTMNSIISNIMGLRDINKFPVVFTTGPAAVASGFQTFIGREDKKGKYPNGIYYGTNNRSIALWGDKDHMTHFIREVVTKKEKVEVYKKSGMTHITVMSLKNKTKTSNNSCRANMYKFAESDVLKSMEYRPNEWESMQ